MAYRKQYHVGFAKKWHKPRTLNWKMTFSSEIDHEYEETVTT